MVAIHDVIKGKARDDVNAAIERVSDKIRGRYSEATFEVDCVADDEVHLYVFTDEDRNRELMEVADDDVDRLQDDHEIFLVVLPQVNRK